MRTRAKLLACVGACLMWMAPVSAGAETVIQALAAAYSNNPEINAARGDTRVADEGVPLAKSGRRPTVSATGDVTMQSFEQRRNGVPGSQTRTDGTLGLQVTQNLFRGFRTQNEIREADANVLGSRQQLENTVQSVLFEAAQAYMNVIRDAAILDVRRQTVGFLEEQVRAAQDRFEVGETTRTDVAQTRARLAASVSEVSLAEANLRASEATYRRVIGHEPRALQANFPFAKHLPRSLGQAVELGQTQHPAILATIYRSEAAAFAVKQLEGQLLPTVSLQGNAQTQFGIGNSDYNNSVSITGRVTVPLYQGGAISAQVRQAKEQLGVRKIETDVTRDQVRASTVSSWGQLDAAKASIISASAQVEAARIALAGVQEERAVGQRTTLDVLNAEQELLDARVNLILAQNDRFVASFALLGSTGRLTPTVLGIPVEVYRPEAHYEAVKDKWYGLRTPDGR
ncbi:TolC family outer membrane protein [Faunimonas sp. B44]|uniref:TolC family outer membrane protein n=1 Tax=Faunimonas sp. B44 TaxID=3461493 RepID=UPI004044EB72